MNCLLNIDNRDYSNAVTSVGYSPLIVIDVDDVKNTHLKKMCSFPSVDDEFLNKAILRDRKYPASLEIILVSIFIIKLLSFLRFFLFGMLSI